MAAGTLVVGDDFTGPVTTCDGGTLTENQGHLNGNVTSHGGTLAMNGKMNGTVTAVDGTLTLTGTLFGAPVVVNGGTMVVSGKVTGVTTVNGGTLTGIGTLGVVNAGSGAHVIHPGGLTTGFGTMTVTTVTGNGNTTLLFDLGTPIRPASAGVAEVLNANVTLNGSVFSFGVPSITAGSLGYYSIIHGAASLSNVQMPTAPAGYAYALDSSQTPGWVDVHLGLMGDANDDGHVV